MGSPVCGASMPATAKNRGRGGGTADARAALCHGNSASAPSRPSGWRPSWPTVRRATSTACYFTLGGSDAVDGAVRFIRYYWYSRQQPQRDQFISVGTGLSRLVDRGRRADGAAWFHAGFGLPSTGSTRSPRPTLPQSGRRRPGRHHRRLVGRAGRDGRAPGGGAVAAFFVEPIQGSGGVVVPPPGWLAAVRLVAGAECCSSPTR